MQKLTNVISKQSRHAIIDLSFNGATTLQFYSDGMQFNTICFYHNFTRGMLYREWRMISIYGDGWIIERDAIAFGTLLERWIVERI